MEAEVANRTQGKAGWTGVRKIQDFLASTARPSCPNSYQISSINNIHPALASRAARHYHLVDHAKLRRLAVPVQRHHAHPLAKATAGARGRRPTPLPVRRA